MEQEQKSIKVYLKRGINIARTVTMVGYWPASLDGVFTSASRLISSSYSVAFFGRGDFPTSSNIMVVGNSPHSHYYFCLQRDVSR